MSPLPASDEYEFCSIFSAVEATEPLHATATRADIWLSLEYTGRWDSRAFPQSNLSAAVKEHVAALEEAVPNVRVQFIRRTGNYTPDPIHFFVSIAHADPPRLYKFLLPAYDELLDLDLQAIVRDDTTYQGHVVDEKLYFVCNNGLRDACCAKFGIPVRQAVEESAGEQAWQCTHIGGHRLAPNLLFLPHALSYGRGTPEIASTLVASYRDGAVHLPHYRGRTTYDRPVQAAEHFFREESGELAVDAYRPLSEVNEGEGAWHVTFAGSDGHEHTVRVAARRWHEPVYKTCDATETSVVEHYELIGFD
ncbi:MAG: sucrase ferredoxin [Anaerolineae bacterium]|nr:sucrase ferredoxin [Anaerolineae bacterium]